MKIVVDSKLESSNKEKATISIEFDPSNKLDEGLAVMIMSVCDTVRQLLVLQEAINNDN